MIAWGLTIPCKYLLTTIYYTSINLLREIGASDRRVGAIRITFEIIDERSVVGTIAARRQHNNSANAGATLTRNAVHYFDNGR